MNYLVNKHSYNVKYKVYKFNFMSRKFISVNEENVDDVIQFINSHNSTLTENELKNYVNELKNSLCMYFANGKYHFELFPIGGVKQTNTYIYNLEDLVNL